MNVPAITKPRPSVRTSPEAQGGHGGASDSVRLALAEAVESRGGRASLGTEIEGVRAHLGELEAEDHRVKRDMRVPRGVLRTA